MDDPYKTAGAWAIEQGRRALQDKGEADPTGEKLVQEVAYWSAWRGARNAAAALLNEAQAAGVTPEQWDRLTRVAEEVAYD